MALEGFNDLLHKLRETHDREVHKWHETFQELTNKKGWLRAGLCDRCTVTQDVAKRRQQDWRDEHNEKGEPEAARGSPASERGTRSGHSSSQDATPEVRQSADLSPSAMPHIPTAIRSINQPPVGATAGLSIVKTETDHSLYFGADGERKENTFRREPKGFTKTETVPERRHVSHKPLSMSNPITSTRPRAHPSPSSPLPFPLSSSPFPLSSPLRAHSVELVGQQRSPVAPSIPHHLLVQKNNPLPSSSSSSSSSTSSSLPGDGKHSRHLVHAPFPYRPRPIKSTRLSLPWPMPEHSDWVTLATSVDECLVSHPNPNPNLPHFPNLQTLVQQSSSTGQAWPKPSHPHQASLTRSLSAEHGERPTAWVQDHDMREAPLSWREVVVQPERVFGECLKEADAPLDLSDLGRSKSSKSLQDSKPSPKLQDVEGQTSNRATRTDSSPQSQACPPSSSSSSSSPPALPSSSSSTRPTSQQRQSPSNHNLKEEEQSEKEEAEGKIDQRTGKDSEDRKVPVLTISLRPVVLLEALNSGLQKQLFSNGKASSGSSSDHQEVEGSLSESVTSQRSKRTGLDTDKE
ncbi:unnamed protein product, partial [Coregonus sp. 'balchen']